MLKIFHLAAKIPVDYDSFDSFVVLAATEIEARELCSDVAGDEGEKFWLSTVTSSCLSIGDADADREPGIVASSFNAG